MVDFDYKTNNFIITIDGPAWVGKSTVSKALSKLLGYKHINSGSIFRSIAYKILNEGIKSDENEKIIEIANQIKIKLKDDWILINGEDVTEKLNCANVITAASEIGVIPEIRGIALKILKNMAGEGGIICEGRDIGTNVFPNADWKFYVCASMGVRIERFIKLATEEEKEKYSKEEIREIIEKIDLREMNKETGLLKMAEDAIIYDNSISPTAEEDAVVLKNYITHWKEMKKNVGIIERKRAK